MESTDVWCQKPVISIVIQDSSKKVPLCIEKQSVISKIWLSIPNNEG